MNIILYSIQIDTVFVFFLKKRKKKKKRNPNNNSTTPQSDSDGPILVVAGGPGVPGREERTLSARGPTGCAAKYY